MADTVDTSVVFSGSRRYVIHITNESDGTGESAVAKVDLSTLVGPDSTAPTRTIVEKIEYQVNGFNYAVLEWNHTTPDEIAVLSGNGQFDFQAVGGKVDPASSGGTGDIQITTDGPVVGASYSITVYLRLKD